MKVIAGLGNPGRSYEGTRHNVGFDVVLRLAKEGPAEERGGDDELAWVRCRIADQVAVLATPLAFMNRSGPPIRDLLAELGSNAEEDLLVVVDDVDLDPGRLRLRRQGSSGGHRGLDSIEAALGTQRWQRLRVGVGRNPPGVPSEDWVLARPSADEAREIARGVERAADGIKVWLARGADRAMEQINRKQTDETE